VVWSGTHATIQQRTHGTISADETTWIVDKLDRHSIFCEQVFTRGRPLRTQLDWTLEVTFVRDLMQASRRIFKDSLGVSICSESDESPATYLDSVLDNAEHAIPVTLQAETAVFSLEVTLRAMKGSQSKLDIFVTEPAGFGLFPNGTHTTKQMFDMASVDTSRVSLRLGSTYGGVRVRLLR
jgi:hypothetical protein